MPLLNTAKPAQESPGLPDGSGEEMQVSPEAKKIVNQAVDILYSPGEGNLENMVQMFQQYGPDRFSDAMAAAVVGTLERVTKDNPDLPTEIIAEVGAKLFEIILQDIMEGGVIQDISEYEALMAQAKILEGWMDKVSPEEAQQLAQLSQQIAQVAEQSKQSQGAQQGVQNPESQEVVDNQMAGQGVQNPGAM